MCNILLEVFEPLVITQASKIYQDFTVEKCNGLAGSTATTHLSRCVAAAFCAGCLRSGGGLRYGVCCVNDGELTLACILIELAQAV